MTIKSLWLFVFENLMLAMHISYFYIDQKMFIDKNNKSFLSLFQTNKNRIKILKSILK